MARLFHGKHTAIIVIIPPQGRLRLFRWTRLIANLDPERIGASAHARGNHNMATPSRPFASIDDLHASELACFEMMARSGVSVAVPAALHYCVEHQLNAPSWLLPAATDMHCSLLKREKSNKRGRSCGAVARYRQDMIDYARWDQIMVVREKQRDILEQAQGLRKLANVPKSLLGEHEKMLAWVGRSLNRAFECAAMLLEGSEAYGSPEAMKRSYFQVRRNSRDPSQAPRYHLLNRPILHKLGLEHDIGHRPRRKPVRLYELTY